MKRRSRLWLLAALALFALAGWLMRGRPPPPAKARHAPSDFPRYQRTPEYERQKARAVMLPQRSGSSGAGPSHEPPRPRDPFLAGLPPSPPGRAKTALVFEAEAIKSMPVGRMFLRCLKDKGSEKMEQELGIGPEAIERVAIGDRVALFNGDFEEARWEQLAEHAKAERRGRATIWTREEPEGTGMAVARWDERFVIVGKSRKDVEAAIDRMEGGESGPPAIREDEAYGEVYGVVGVDDLARILEREQPELAERLKGAADRVELHVDATEDVLLVGDLSGSDGAALGDLGKSLGGAMSVARLTAKADGNDDLAELLDAARVSPYGDAFRLEAALPLAMIEKTLGPCAKERGGAEDE